LYAGQLTVALNETGAMLDSLSAEIQEASSLSQVVEVPALIWDFPHLIHHRSTVNRAIGGYSIKVKSR
jgi:hypothetical protein